MEDQIPEDREGELWSRIKDLEETNAELREQIEDLKAGWMGKD